MRHTVDTAIERLRKASSEMRTRAGDEAADFEDRLEHASEEVRRDLGRRAIAAQQSPEALTELAGSDPQAEDRAVLRPRAPGRGGPAYAPAPGCVRA